jgi:hypothetical protein
MFCGLCIVMYLLAASRHKCMTYTNCYIYRTIPPDDEQYARSKHVEFNYQPTRSRFSIVFLVKSFCFCANYKLRCMCTQPYAAIPKEYTKLNLKCNKFPTYFLYFLTKIFQLPITTALFPEVLLCL